ncbi:hypothetical protein [Pseudomonas sp.]|uniref:hypothetical protein n=1 Tax=Pseudomonas sp. TaxID=306 RepID=UPI003BB4DE16
MYRTVLYRGTTELWEQVVIEASLPPINVPIAVGSYLQKVKVIKPNLENEIRTRIAQKPCSTLRSGKEIILGNVPVPLSQLNAQQINQEIVARVGVETAFGTPNYFSHFVPCGTYSGISENFGHGGYYRFEIQGKIYGPTPQDIEEYVAERHTLPSYVIPLFRGGSNEVLAYTGSLITSVVLMRGSDVYRTVLNSLD